MSLAACASVCVCTWKRDVIESGALFSFQRESAFSRTKNHERASKCMHTCVGRYCDGGNDEWAAHFKRPTLPRWWGSLRDTGQSLITLPVRVSQPHLHKPDANHMHLMLIFTRHHISSLTELRHATLCKLSWLWKPNPHSLNSFAWLKGEPVCMCDLTSMKLALACNLLYLQIQKKNLRHSGPTIAHNCANAHTVTSSVVLVP